MVDEVDVSKFILCGLLEVAEIAISWVSLRRILVHCLFLDCAFGQHLYAMS